MFIVLWPIKFRGQDMQAKHQSLHHKLINAAAYSLVHLIGFFFLAQ